ncbi:MAG: hypothetical protein IPO08_20520 [Xanthomonadales bacterium]|nr:hypothetical protein [Xanthomonadales bacterium]
MSDSVTELRLDHQEEKMQDLRVSIEKLNDTIAGMTRTFIAAQVCEQRVAKMEGEQTEMGKAVQLLAANSSEQKRTLEGLETLVKSHDTTVVEVRRLKQLLLGGIGLSALVNPTAQKVLAQLAQALGGGP